MGDRNDHLHSSLFGEEARLVRERRDERRLAEAIAFHAMVYKTMPEDIRQTARSFGLEAFMCGVWSNGFQNGYLQRGRDEAARASGEKSGEDSADA